MVNETLNKDILKPLQEKLNLDSQKIPLGSVVEDIYNLYTSYYGLSKVEAKNKTFGDISHFSEVTSLVKLQPDEIKNAIGGLAENIRIRSDIAKLQYDIALEKFQSPDKAHQNVRELFDFIELYKYPLHDPEKAQDYIETLNEARNQILGAKQTGASAVAYTPKSPDLEK